MKPVPETREALAAIRTGDDEDLESVLDGMGRTAQAIVPQLVGLSVGLLRDGLTFTLVASSGDVSGVDAAQYLDGGPCLWEDVRDPRPVAADLHDLLEDAEWELFARTGLASGIASSLSLPIVDQGTIVGGINLYASTPGAFEGHYELLAASLGATAQGAVADADLSFASRRRAALAPVRLRDRNDVDTATGLLAARHHEPVSQAVERLAQAALRAGLSQAAAARVVLGLHAR
jgi:GAF domain-containing protein